MIAHCLFEQSGTFKNEFKKLGRNFIGCELDREYYDISANRIKQTVF